MLSKSIASPCIVTLILSFVLSDYGIDLMDNINQTTHPSFGDNSTTYPNDNVSGYSLKQIETALTGATNVYVWENNLLRFYANSTENNLDELFDNWREEY